MIKSIFLTKLKIRKKQTKNFRLIIHKNFNDFDLFNNNFYRKNSNHSIIIHNKHSKFFSYEI